MQHVSPARRVESWRRAASAIAVAAALNLWPSIGRSQPTLEPISSPLQCATSHEVFRPPTPYGVRGTDRWGSGDYGAPRDHGTRQHLGIDFVARPGEPVIAPASGTVLRIGRAYGDTDRYLLIVIAMQTGCQMHILYVLPTVELGDVVQAGQVIGYAEDLQPRYGGICDHVHFEIRYASRVLDPRTAFAVDALDVGRTALAER